MQEMIVEGLVFKLFFVCIVIGAMGQAIRVFVGLYKLFVDEKKDFAICFDGRRLLVSIILGALIGALLSISGLYKLPLSFADVLGILGASYMGVDTLEGFLRKRGAAVK
jgi:hypothetical protein